MCRGSVLAAADPGSTPCQSLPLSPCFLSPSSAALSNKATKAKKILLKSIHLYGRASSARVNWAKCEALYCGMGNSGLPTLPSGLQWKSNGLKVLGVFLVDPVFEQQNWEDVVAKVCARLSNWHCLLPQLSYRGRGH